MALFSRRGKKSSAPGADEDSRTTDAAVPAAGDPAAIEVDPAPIDAPADAAPGSAPASSAQDAADASPEAPAEVVPQVSISLSTFGQPAPAPVAPSGTPQLRRMKRGPAEAPAPSESVPGMPDNVLVRQALAAFPEKPGPADFIGVMRQLMQGHLFVRVRGDARTQLSAGETLTMAVSAIGDDRYLLAFTGGDALQASVLSDGDAQTSALGQPALGVLRNVVAGPYAGIIIDHATPGKRAILPRALVEKAIDEADQTLVLKNMLAGVRTEQTRADVAIALGAARLWLAANVVPGDEKRVGIAESRGADGTRRLEVFTHPLEIAALGRDDRAVPVTGPQLAKALAADTGLTGLLIDPAGPWLELDRDDLEGLSSLEEPAAE